MKTSLYQPSCSQPEIIFLSFVDIILDNLFTNNLSGVYTNVIVPSGCLKHKKTFIYAKLKNKQTIIKKNLKIGWKKNISVFQTWNCGKKFVDRNNTRDTILLVKMISDIQVYWQRGYKIQSCPERGCKIHVHNFVDKRYKIHNFVDREGYLDT